MPTAVMEIYNINHKFCLLEFLKPSDLHNPSCIFNLLINECDNVTNGFSCRLNVINQHLIHQRRNKRQKLFQQISKSFWPERKRRKRKRLMKPRRRRM